MTCYYISAPFAINELGVPFYYITNNVRHFTNVYFIVQFGPYGDRLLYSVFVMLSRGKATVSTYVS